MQQRTLVLIGAGMPGFAAISSQESRMQHRILAFIGAGNMSRSIIAGLVQAGYPADRIIAANPSRPKLDELASRFGIRVTQDNAEAAREAEVIVLAVKPQLMAGMLTTLGRTRVAGGQAARLHRRRHQGGAFAGDGGGHGRIIRTMPNTPPAGAGDDGALRAARHRAGRSRLRRADDAGGGQDPLGGAGVRHQRRHRGGGQCPGLLLPVHAGDCRRGGGHGLLPEQARLLVQQTALGAAAMVEQNPALSLQTLGSR